MRPTTFIVGAGASTDFGMPLGSALAAQIREQLTREIANSHDHSSMHVLQAAMTSGLDGDYLEAARTVAGGMISARSIDRFLDARRDQQLTIEMGKCAIAYSMLKCERDSGLAAARTGDWLAVQSGLINCAHSWLANLFSLVQEGRRPAESESLFRNVSFVTFNYDRCIEKYLTCAFTQVMGLSASIAEQLVDMLDITHIYGSLDGDSTSTPRRIQYGEDPNGARELVSYAANGLRTFHEGAVEEAVEAARNSIYSSEQVVFLGFAFDPVNVGLLFPRKLHSAQEMLGTQLGVADPEWNNFVLRAGAEGRAYNFQKLPTADYCRSLEFRTVCSPIA